jgi:hypothetical protein
MKFESSLKKIFANKSLMKVIFAFLIKRRWFELVICVFVIAIMFHQHVKIEECNIMLDKYTEGDNSISVVDRSSPNA